MENQERNMETPDDKGLSLSRKSPRPSDLTVMVLGKVGKLRSFKISSRVFFWSSLFFVLYILASIIVINAYFSELRAGRIKSQLLEQLQDEVKKTERALNRSKQHLTLLEETIQSFITSKEEQTSMSVAETEETVNKYPINHDKSIKKKQEESLEEQVSIEAFKIERKETKMAVSFRLVNARQEEGPVSGYIHIIAINKDADPPQFWTYPKVPLKNGLPVNYKRGQLFLIKRFKAIRGEYSLNSGTEIPYTIDVIVYDALGNLIFRKNFEVNNAS